MTTDNKDCCGCGGCFEDQPILSSRDKELNTIHRLIALRDELIEANASSTEIEKLEDDILGLQSNLIIGDLFTEEN
jgi:hypothetical protein